MGLELQQLLAPERLHAWSELEFDRDRPPRRPGTYAWYFASAALPTSLPIASAHTAAGEWVLLYVGIAPSKPSPDRPPSRKTLRSRLRFHFCGNARGSTLRLTLGCLLGEQLGIRLGRVGSGDRLTFGDGEKVLSTWMAEHARVCWIERERPWELEDLAIETLDLPLNLAGNRRHPFHQTLSMLRRSARDRALL